MPVVSHRAQVFFRTKDILVKKLGSEQAAIALMSKDPSLMLCPRYDGISPKLEAMLSDAELSSVSSTAPGQGVQPVLLLAAVALAGGAAVLAASGGTLLAQ